VGKLPDPEWKGERKWKNFGKDFPRGDGDHQRRREAGA